MNPTLITLLAILGGALCALLIIGSGLIHASLKRNRAAALGRFHKPSRILNDLRPVKALLVEFVARTRELADVLAILSPFQAPESFARLVHETQIRKDDSVDLKVAANLVGPSLFVLGLAGLIRVQGGGFVATEVGREVQRRIDRASQAGGDVIQSALT